MLAYQFLTGEAFRREGGALVEVLNVGKGLSQPATRAFRNHFAISASVSNGETTAEIDFRMECALFKAVPINAVFLDTTQIFLFFVMVFVGVVGT